MMKLLLEKASFLTYNQKSLFLEDARVSELIQVFP